MAMADLHNVPVAAAALYNLLAGLFTFIDEEVEPRKLGVITCDKMKWVAEQVGMQAEFAASLSMAPEALATTYGDLECQYYVVPAMRGGRGSGSGSGNGSGNGNGNGGALLPPPPPTPHEYSFEEPDIPGLTRAGFIKMQALGLIQEAAPPPAPGTVPQSSGDMEYRFLQRCISTFPLSYTDPTTGIKLTFPPLPPQHVVSWYVSVLAQTILGIDDPTPAGIQARVAARRQEPTTPSFRDQQLLQSHGHGHGNHPLEAQAGGTGIYGQEHQHPPLPTSQTQAAAPGLQQHEGLQHPGPQHPGPQHPGLQHPGPQYPGPQHSGQGQQHPGQQHPGPHPVQHTGPAAWPASGFAILS